MADAIIYANINRIGDNIMAISAGNSKLGKIPNVSLTPIKSCVNCDHCAPDCYAMKSYRMHPTVKASWDSNLDMAVSRPASYFGMIGAYLTKKKPAYFRWHVAGDILDWRYLKDMISIAIEHPDTRFLAFTKHFKLDFRRVPSNLTIVFSMWPGMGKPRQKKGVAGYAWYQDGTETRIPDNAIHCPGHCDTCGMCFDIAKTSGHVTFIKH